MVDLPFNFNLNLYIPQLRNKQVAKNVCKSVAALMTNFSTVLQGNWHPLVGQTKKTAPGVGPQWGDVTKQFE